MKQSASLGCCAAIAAALLFSTAAHGDSYNWTGLYPTGDWDAVFPPPLNLIPGNWFDNTTSVLATQVPGAGDDVTLGGASYIPLGVNMTGPHSVNSITFDTPQTFAINNSGGLNTALTLTSGSLTQTSSDTGTQTISVPITIGAAANWSLNGSGTIIVSQPVSSNNNRLSLVTTGPGNLTLQGQNTYQGLTGIGGTGTVLLTGSIGVAIGGAITSNLAVDSQQGANFVLASSATDTSTLITTNTIVGNKQTGTFTQNGGSHITRQLSVAFSSGGNGTYNLINGSLTTTTHSSIVGGDSSGDTLARGSQGVFNQSGGVHQTPQLEVGSSPGASGTYNLSAGVLSVSQATFIGEADGANGLFNQTGGQNTTQALVLGISIQENTDPVISGGWNRVNNINDLGTVLTNSPPDRILSAVPNQPAAQPAVRAKYVLTGGTLTTEAVEGLSTGTEFDFNGGTLKPTVSLTTFISGLDAAVVQAGGAVIDTNGFNETVPQPLSHDASLGATPDGGLTKNGTGRLTLTGSATYTGPTVVNGGTLNLPAATGVLSSTSFTSNVAGNLTIQGGTLAPGGSIVDNGTVLTNQFQSNGTIIIAGGANAATFYDDATNLVLAAGSHTYVGSPATPGGNLTMQNGATIDLSGTLANNGTIAGEVDVNTGGVLSGSGRTDTISVKAGGTLHAGNSPGTMRASTVTLAGNSTLQFDINSATGTAGTNWSLLAIDGDLTIGGVLGKNPNILKLISVSGQDDSRSPLTDFNPAQSYSWQFATFDGFQSHGGQQLFQIDLSEFENPTDGGKFSIGFVDGSLTLDFTPVPEPTSASLLFVASLACFRRRRGKQM